MRENHWSKIEEIFNAAVILPIAAKRSFVIESCRSDIALRDEVFALLEEDENLNSILDKPVFSLGVQLLDVEFDELLQNSEFASYYLHKKIGRGGMGVVFLAEDSRLERFVALKVLLPQFTENNEGVLRFQQEARAASAISHPNVAHIYEAGIYKEYNFLAMEYVPGKILREVIKENPIELSCAVEIALQIGKALVAAHKAGIVHRDIKPENIMIVEENDEFLVKVLDFGLAKFGAPLNNGNKYVKTRSSGRTSLETTPGMIIGTTAYMSPEQVRGIPLDARTDIWSLGVVLFEMLTGKRPFRGDTRSDVQAGILLGALPPISKIKNAPELATIVQKALTKDVEERYQNIIEFVHDLQAVQNKIKADTEQYTATQIPFASKETHEELENTSEPTAFLKRPVISLIGLILALMIIVFFFNWR